MATCLIFAPRQAKTSGVWSSYRQGHEDHLSDRAIDVQAIGLEQLLYERRIDTVDLLKIDVEGAEYAILYGAEKVLPRVARIHGEFPRRRSRRSTHALEHRCHDGCRVSHRAR